MNTLPMDRNYSNEILAIMMVCTVEARDKLAKELAKPGVVPDKVQILAVELILSGRAGNIGWAPPSIVNLPITSSLPLKH
jgi:hypothetical protein